MSYAIGALAISFQISYCVEDIRDSDRKADSDIDPHRFGLQNHQLVLARFPLMFLCELLRRCSARPPARPPTRLVLTAGPARAQTRGTRGCQSARCA